jgi:hypothetical protein
MATVYVDNTKESSTITGANWLFTNASTSVTETGAAGNALAEVAVDDYIRINAGTQWYRVTAIPDDDTITISPAFQQGTNTDTCKLNSEDGSATGSAYAHPDQAVTHGSLSAGDIVKLRANQTHKHGGINLLLGYNGTINNWITFKGCDSVDDPWSDGSDVRPIIDFDNTNFNVSQSVDNYWKIEHLALKASIDSSGIWSIGSSWVRFEDCKFFDSGDGIGDEAIGASACKYVYIKDCIFDNVYGNAITVNDCNTVLIEGCISDGDTVGGGNPTRAAVSAVDSTVLLKDCSFGVTDPHDLADILVDNAHVFGRNVKLGSSTEVTFNGVTFGFVSLEDDEQNHLAYRRWNYQGNLSRTTAVNRSGSGGTAWSVLGEPNSNCGVEIPLYIMGEWLYGVPIQLSGAEQTITVYAYADSTGGGWTPDNTEFYFEIEHYESSGVWATDKSSEAFVAEDVWKSFSITLTPGAAGPAYLKAVLKDYVAGGKIYIDPTPVFS